MLKSVAAVLQSEVKAAFTVQWVQVFKSRVLIPVCVAPSANVYTFLCGFSDGCKHLCSISVIQKDKQPLGDCTFQITV